MYLRLLLCLALLPAACVHAQQPSKNTGPLWIQPAMGILPWGLPVKGSLSVVLEYPIMGSITLASHSAAGSALSRNSYDIQTNYSIFLAQQLGAGFSFSGRKKFARYSFLLLGGVKHIAFKETLRQPELETVTTTSRTTMPDIGLSCGISLGRGRYRFHTRAYLPFYPFYGYPISTYTSISFEAGIGICLP